MSSQGKRSRGAANLLEQLAHTGDGVFAVDRHHHIILWNQAAKSLLGYSAQEALGKNCHDIMQGRDANGVLICSKQCSHFEAAKSLRRLPHENLCARAKNGAAVWINVTTLSVLSQRRKLSTLVHFFRGLPERCSPGGILPPDSIEQCDDDGPRRTRRLRCVPVSPRGSQLCASAFLGNSCQPAMHPTEDNPDSDTISVSNHKFCVK